MPTPVRASRGFTLLEVLVAIGIFALFSAMAYGGLTRMLESRDRLDAEREFWRGLALAFAQIEDDLAQARARSVRDVYGLSLPAFRGQPVDTRATAIAAIEFTRGGLIVLGRSPRADLQRLGYRLEDGLLSRLTWPHLDRAPADQPQTAPLLEHVEELRLRFYAPAGAWVDVWPPEGQPQLLPLAVEFTVRIKGRGEFQRLLRVNA